MAELLTSANLTIVFQKIKYTNQSLFDALRMMINYVIVVARSIKKLKIHHCHGQNSLSNVMITTRIFTSKIVLQ